MSNIALLMICLFVVCVMGIHTNEIRSFNSQYLNFDQSNTEYYENYYPDINFAEMKQQEPLFHVVKQSQQLLPKISFYPVLFREYVVSYNKPIGAFGLLSSIGIALWDPLTKKSMLALVDPITDDPIDIFNEHFSDSEEVHVSMCGADWITLDQAMRITSDFINYPKYRPINCHLIETASNSIGIDPATGNVYLNHNMTFTQSSLEILVRLNTMSSSIQNPGPLKQIYISE